MSSALCAYRLLYYFDCFRVLGHWFQQLFDDMNYGLFPSKHYTFFYTHYEGLDTQIVSSVLLILMVAKKWILEKNGRKEKKTPGVGGRGWGVVVR